MLPAMAAASTADVQRRSRSTGIMGKKVAAGLLIEDRSFEGTCQHSEGRLSKETEGVLSGECESARERKRRREVESR